MVSKKEIDTMFWDYSGIGIYGVARNRRFPLGICSVFGMNKIVFRSRNTVYSKWQELCSFRKVVGLNERGGNAFFWELIICVFITGIR